MNTTACKRLFSLGCVPHTDGGGIRKDFMRYTTREKILDKLWAVILDEW